MSELNPFASNNEVPSSDANPFASAPKPVSSEPNPLATNRDGNASESYTKFEAPNVALRFLEYLQVPTTLINQQTLGESADPHRVTTGVDVQRALQDKPVLDRFNVPNLSDAAAKFVTNPFALGAQLAYENVPAALSIVTPNFDRSTKASIEAGAQAIPGIPSPIKTVSGKLVSNPELVTGLLSDVIRDPLNVVGPVVAAPMAKIAGKGIRAGMETLGEAFPDLKKLKGALETRFIHPSERVAPDVKALYEQTLSKKNLSEHDVLQEAAYGIEKLKAIDLPDNQILDLLEKPKYGIQDAVKAAPDPDKFAKLHTYTLGFRGRRAADKEALQKAGIAVDLQGYVPHILTEEGKGALGETGVAKLGFDKQFNLIDPSLFKRNIKGSINEINAKAVSGTLEGFEGRKLPPLFESDPVTLDALAKVRTQKLLGEVDFYKGLRQFASKDPGAVEIEAKLFGKNLLEGLRFDPVVKELVDNSKQFIFSDELNNLFDKVMNGWKSAVTSINPQFSMRNAFSNLVSAGAEGLTNPRYYKIGAEIQAGADGLLTTLTDGTPITYADVRRIATEHGLNKGFFSADNPQALKEMIYPSKNPIALSRAANSAIESHAKISLLAYKLARGASVEEAVNTVNRALFDYSKTTAFEKQVMQKWFPFYRWMRFNTPRQAELALMKPQVNSKLGILKGNIEALEPLSAKDREAIPGYYDDLLSIHLGKSPSTHKELFMQLGLPQVELSRFSLDPDKSLSDNVLDSLGSFVGALNPLAKAGIELIGNRSTMDLHRDATVDKEKQLVRVPEWIGLLPDSFQRLLAVREDRKTNSLAMPRIVGSLVNNLFSVPGLRLAGKQSSDKLDAEEKAFSLMAFLTGIKFIPTDLKKAAIQQYKQKIYERRNQRSDAKRFKEVDNED